jgi:Glu-tRNA(Gln) amidotransferase subunit E-like FAD-binding protein
MPLDYKKLKFKAGLEIHQQLDTRKLYCNCPSVLRNDEPDFEIKRKLHAVAGESGEFDVAALYQASLGKQFVYYGYDSTCLVELDEEPPHQINREALKIAVQVSLLLNCKIVSITQIMRKTVIDGSNTSGFQRTVLVGYDGYVETESGRVGIENVYLEEDAARIVSRGEDKVVYKLDRLGIPLVEIVTAPDIKSPEQAKEVALHIGNVLRSSKVKRGIGTIRQDVNVSIRGENRIEIKGMQDMKVFVKAIENEVERQKKLSDAKKPVEMEVRNVLPDATTEYMRPLPGSSRMYPETDLPLLKISRVLINEAKKDLPKLKDDVEKDLRKQGLSQEMIKILFKQNKLGEFESMLKIVSDAPFVANVLLVYPKDIAKRTGKSVSEDLIDDVLQNVAKKKLSKSNVKQVMQDVVLGKSLKEAILMEKVDVGEVEEKIMKMIRSQPGLSSNAYMGLVMKEFRGKVDGKTAMEIIKKYVK